MMIALLLYYKKFKNDIKTIGFEVNLYDPCVANCQRNGKQHTITWHVDDIKSSHVDLRVNDEFLEWLKKTYKEDGIGTVVTTRGKRHNYLAMILDFLIAGVLKLNMVAYIKQMIKDSPEKLESVSCPWSAEKLFKVNETSPLLKEPRWLQFHTFVMKCMFLCKRARQDIQPAITFLFSRTSKSTENDWRKLVRVMSFLKWTKDDVAHLEAGDHQVITWYMDAAFAVHPDYKSHTGAVMTLGKGCANRSHSG